MPRLPENVEPSAFRRGEYVAYDPRGGVWHVSKCGRDWFATPAANNPARSTGKTYTGATLAVVAQSIAARRPPVFAFPSSFDLEAIA